MPKLPRVNHLDAVRALQKIGFRIVRQKKHIIMSNGSQTLIVPRHMANIVRDAGLTNEEFRRLI
jgi:predicted RNA binding protein YcfA (HicA-like mRNA interferase family)